MLMSGKNSSNKSPGEYGSPEVQLLSKLQLHEENIQDKQNMPMFKVRFMSSSITSLCWKTAIGKTQSFFCHFLLDSTEPLFIGSHFRPETELDVLQQGFIVSSEGLNVASCQRGLAGIKGRICCNIVAFICNYLFASKY